MARAEQRHRSEYCENGAKHINDEATTRRITRQFFAEHPVAELDTMSDYWLNQQGRLTEPMVKRPGATHYEPIDWDDAFDLMPRELRGLATPDEALFYTSGRLNNEAAFLYNCSPAPTAPTTCPTARTCATSRAVPRWTRPSASARAPCRWTISTKPT